MKDKKMKKQKIPKVGKGTYTNKYTIVENGKEYKVTEETKFNNKFEIISRSKSYNPPIPYS